MASILDIGLVNVFGSVFTFLLVYAILWGVLTWKKPFGDKNTGVYSIIALTCALFASVVAPIKAFIGFIAPWYVAFALVLFFILFLTTLFGKSPEKDFPKIIDDSRVYIWIVIISIVIFLAGLAFAFGQTALDQSTGTTPIQQGNPNIVVIGAGGQPYQAPGTVVEGQGVVGNYYSNGVPQAGEPGSTSTSDYKTNLINTFFHPKVLGLLVILVIASLAIYFLSAN